MKLITFSLKLIYDQTQPNQNTLFNLNENQFILIDPTANLINPSLSD